MVGRVLYIEQSTSVGGVVEALLQNGWQVDRILSAPKSFDEAAIHDHQVVVIDSDVPAEPSALELCSYVRARAPYAGLLVLSACTASPSKVKVLEAGADDYLTKDMKILEILARIYALCRRLARGASDRASYRIGALDVDLVRCQATVDGQRVLLTMGQWAVLVRMLPVPGKVVSREELRAAAGICQDPDGARLRAIVHDLRTRLGAAGVLIESCRGAGYRLVTGKARLDRHPSGTAQSPGGGTASRPGEVEAL